MNTQHLSRPASSKRPVSSKKPHAIFSQAGVRSRLSLRLALLLLLVLNVGMRVNAQVLPPQSHATTARQEIKDESEDADDDSQSEPAVVAATRGRVTDPAAVLRAARTVIVHSDTAFINEREVEDSLRKRKEFQAWGMVITRNDGEADLSIEITRKAFTRRFTFTVLDPRTMLVVTSGKTRSVLFGKKVANKIAEKFANRVRVVRPYTGA
ncbi:MAG: hypothetical protein WCD76_22230 [Pyrinomonadaceae bacterium]